MVIRPVPDGKSFALVIRPAQPRDTILNGIWQMTTHAWVTLVSRSQTAFFRFLFVVAEKGSGDLTIEFACDEIPSFWGALIALFGSLV